MSICDHCLPLWQLLTKLQNCTESIRPAALVTIVPCMFTWSVMSGIGEFVFFVPSLFGCIHDVAAMLCQRLWQLDINVH